MIKYEAHLIAIYYHPLGCVAPIRAHPALKTSRVYFSSYEMVLCKNRGWCDQACKIRFYFLILC